MEKEEETFESVKEKRFSTPQIQINLHKETFEDFKTYAKEKNEPRSHILKAFARQLVDGDFEIERKGYAYKIVPPESGGATIPKGSKPAPQHVYFKSQENEEAFEQVCEDEGTQGSHILRVFIHQLLEGNFELKREGGGIYFEPAEED